MKNTSLSISNIIKDATKKFDNKFVKIFSASLLYFLIFVISFAITGSVFVSAVIYSIFIGGFVSYINKVVNNQVSRAEEIFLVDKTTLTIALAMAFYIAAGSLSFVLLIIPGFLFLINFSFVPLIYSTDKTKSIFDYYKQSHEEVKGYRGKMLWLILIFFFVFVLFTGIGVLVTFLIKSIFFSSFILLSIWFGGIGIGSILFMIVGLPFLIVTMTDFREAILKDKEKIKADKIVEELKKSQPEEADEDEVEKIDSSSNKVIIEDDDK